MSHCICGNKFHVSSWWEAKTRTGRHASVALEDIQVTRSCGGLNVQHRSSMFQRRAMAMILRLWRIQNAMRGSLAATAARTPFQGLSDPNTRALPAGRSSTDHPASLLRLGEAARLSSTELHGLHCLLPPLRKLCFSQAGATSEEEHPPPGHGRSVGLARRGCRARRPQLLPVMSLAGITSGAVRFLKVVRL